MKIFYFAPLKKGSISLMRLKALKKVYPGIVSVDNYIDVGILNGWSFIIWLESIGVSNKKISLINDTLLRVIPNDAGKGILVLDKAQCITATTLSLIKKKCPNYILVNFNPDNPYIFRSFGWSLYHQCLPYVDIFFVPRESTKLYIEYKYKKTSVLFNWAIDKSTHMHRSSKLSCKKGADQKLIFIGSCEYRRLFFLLVASFMVPGKIYIWGEKWGVFKYWPLFTCAGYGLYGDKYKEKTMDSKMVFCFFNRSNKDDQNTRFYSLLGLNKIMIVEETNVVNKVLGLSYPLKFGNILDFLLIIKKIKNDNIEQGLVIDSYNRSRKYVKSIDEQMAWMVSKINQLSEDKKL